MAIKNNLWEASYNGIKFFVTGENENLTRRLQVLGSPFSDDYNIIDLGSNASVYSLQIFVIGKDCYKSANDLMNEVRKNQSGILIHPRLGRKTVRSESISLTKQAANLNYVELSAVFIEDLTNLLISQNINYGEQLTQKSEEINSNTAALLSRHKNLNLLDETDKLNFLNSVTRQISIIKDTCNRLKITALLPIPAGSDLDRLGKEMFFLGATIKGMNVSMLDTDFYISSLLYGLNDLANLAGDIPETQTYKEVQILDYFVGLITLLTNKEFTDTDQIQEFKKALDTILDSLLEDHRTISFKELLKIKTEINSFLNYKSKEATQLMKVVVKELTPAIVLSYQLYGNSSGEADIIKRTKAFNPLFVPEGTYMLKTA